MWIFDSYFKGCVELLGRERGLTKVSAACPPSFYMHLKDPPAYREMIEALESRFKAEDCSFRTIFGTFQGHKIYAGRKVAEKIEIQTTTGPSYTMWMYGRISGTWPSMISSPAENGRNPGSAPTLKFL